MKRLALVGAAIFAFPFASNAGVTIHFEGYVASTDAVSQVISVATAFAKLHGWQVKDASSSNGKLERVINEKNADYAGKITGIVIITSSKCEPIYIQFGDDLFMQDFVKTQFAGGETHIGIIELFSELKSHFRKLEINDEGEYWETRNRETLERNISTVNRMMEEVKKRNPKAKGPVFLPSGRIVDIVQ